MLDDDNGRYGWMRLIAQWRAADYGAAVRVHSNSEVDEPEAIA